MALDTGFPSFFPHALTLCSVPYNVDTLFFVAAQKILSIHRLIQTNMHSYYATSLLFFFAKSLLARIHFSKPS